METDLSCYVGQGVEAQLPQRDERAVCAEKEEAQTRAVHRQLLDVGLLEGQVPQDDGYLQHALSLHVRRAHVPLWVKQRGLHGTLPRAIWRQENNRKAPFWVKPTDSELLIFPRETDVILPFIDLIVKMSAQTKLKSSELQTAPVRHRVRSGHASCTRGHAHTTP